MQVVAHSIVKMSRGVVSALVASLALVVATSASAVSISSSGIDFGANAGLAIVSVGNNASLTINSGPINGNLLVGQGSVISTSGGGNGQINGTIFHDSTINPADFSHLQVPPTAGQFQTVPTSLTTQAFNDAAALSAAASALTPNQTITNLTANTTFTSTGLFVVDVNKISNANITLDGNANSVFVFNVSGSYSTNQTLTLLDGVKATNVLFNFTASSGNVFQTSGGDTSLGTYLATNGGDFQFSNLHLTGNLINTGGHIQFVSGSKSTFIPTVPVPAPAVASVVLLAGVALLKLRRRFQAAF